MLDIFLSGVLPVFVVMLVGVLLGRQVAPGLPAVNRLALYGAVPALVFDSLSGAELSAGGALRLIGGHALFMAGMAGLASLAGWRLAPRARRGMRSTSLFSNSANLMLPVTLFTLGESALALAVILYVFVTVAMFSLAPLVLAGREGMTAARLAAVARLPVIWASLAGLAVNLLGWTLPLGLGRGVGLLADAAIPLVLLILGVQIWRSGLSLPGAGVWLAALFKLLAGPLVAFGAGVLIGAGGLELAVLTLLGAMPPAVNNLMLALEFGGDAEGVAKTIVLATLLAMATLPVVVFAVR